MPILYPAAVTQIRARIDAVFGPINSGLRPQDQAIIDDYRQRLAMSIAEAPIYTQVAAVVNPGQSVQVNPSTGTGAVIAPGTIS